MCGPIFAEEVAARYAGAVIAATDEVHADGWQVFADAFWPRVTKGDWNVEHTAWIYMNIQQAYDTAMDSFDPGYLPSSGLDTLQLIGDSTSGTLGPAF